MKKIHFLPVVLIAVITACTQSEKPASGGSDTTAVQTADAVDVKIKDAQTDQMFDHYIDLKNDLVSSKADAAQASAQHLSDALANIDGCENTAKLAVEIAASSDINVQRDKFTALSADIIALMKHADLSSGNIYVQYCPMANENEGGYWLASDKTIRNPYYGSEMLNCGQITETLTAK